MAIFTIRSKKAKKIKVENTCLIILLFYGQLIQEKCIILNIFTTIYSTKTYLLLNVLYPQNTPHQSTTILDHFKEKKSTYTFLLLKKQNCSFFHLEKNLSCR